MTLFLDHVPALCLRRKTRARRSFFAPGPMSQTIAWSSEAAFSAKVPCWAQIPSVPEGWYLPEGSVWFGSAGGEPTCLEKGVEGDLAGPLMASEVEEDKLQFNGDDSTRTPFGRAFYQRKAPYFVYRLWIPLQEKECIFKTNWLRLKGKLDADKHLRMTRNRCLQRPAKISLMKQDATNPF